MKKNNYRLTATNYKLLVLLFVSFLLITKTDAQTPGQVILTWQANNFYPADYTGKALATPNTPVTISAEVLRDGKLVNLSEGTFTWYVDEKFLNRAQGLKEIFFAVKKSAGDSHFIRVAIQLGNSFFESSIRIPVSKQIVVLESPYSNNLVRAGSQAVLQAIPYFFNIPSFQDLTFSWQINNDERKGSGNDNQLVLNIGTPQTPDQDVIRITTLVQNKNNPLEFSNERIQLTIIR
ncbi:MAG: hypothetical protein KJI72_02180 [Patescibacteria group bacterium]|nr:hypothetical protein [Patescibacteria group bacterium]